MNILEISAYIIQIFFQNIRIPYLHHIQKINKSGFFLQACKTLELFCQIYFWFSPFFSEMYAGFINISPALWHLQLRHPKRIQRQHSQMRGFSVCLSPLHHKKPAVPWVARYFTVQRVWQLYSVLHNLYIVSSPAHAASDFKVIFKSLYFYH